MEKKIIERVLPVFSAYFDSGGKVNGELFEGLSNEDWEEVLAFVSAEGLLPVFVEILNQVPKELLPDRPLLLGSFGLSEKQRQGYDKRMETMRQLTALFRQHGLDVLYIKGATLAQFYPQPDRRVCSDIDYYMYGKSDDSIRVLAEAGVETKEYFHHHTQAEVNAILLENHYDFFDRVNHKCNLALDDCLKQLAEKEGRNRPFLFDGAYQMTPTMNAIFLMRHMSAHFVSETVTLRQLCDWALFLINCSEEVDWTLVLKEYKQAGMMKFAAIIQYVITEKMRFLISDCPIEPQEGTIAEKVWQSILFPPEADTHKKYGLQYYLFELRTFAGNKWKHQLVYPKESYLRLAFIYVGSHIKKKLNILSH